MILLVSPMLCDLEANTSQWVDLLRKALSPGLILFQKWLWCNDGRYRSCCGPYYRFSCRSYCNRPGRCWCQRRDHQVPIWKIQADVGYHCILCIPKGTHTPRSGITSPPTAQYLGAYITAITCVLHHLFLEIVVSDHSNTVSEDLISRMVAQYKGTQCFRHQNLIRNMGVIGFEKKIAKLIMEETHTSEMDSASAPQDSNTPHHSGGPSGEEQAETPGRNPERRPPAWKRLFAKKFSPSTWHPSRD